MTDIEVIKIIFTTLLLSGSCILFLLAYLLFYKYLIQEKKCVTKTKGKVIRYSQIKYGEGVHPPVVEYFVGDKRYKVVGPEYKGSITKTTLSTFGENRNTRFEETESQILRITKYQNSAVTRYSNPLEEKYPIGSEVDVYYCPYKPKLAYVERYCNQKFWFWIMAGVSMVLIIGTILLHILLG